MRFLPRPFTERPDGLVEVLGLCLVRIAAMQIEGLIGIALSCSDNSQRQPASAIRIGQRSTSTLLTRIEGAFAGVACAGLTIYAILRQLQHILATMAGARHTCKRPYPNTS